MLGAVALFESLRKVFGDRRSARTIQLLLLSLVTVQVILSGRRGAMNPWTFGAAMVLLLAFVYGGLRFRIATIQNPRKRKLMIGVMALISIAVFWSGSKIVKIGEKIQKSYENRAPGLDPDGEEIPNETRN